MDRLFLEGVRGTRGEGWVRHGPERRKVWVKGVPDGSRLLSLRLEDPR